MFSRGFRDLVDLGKSFPQVAVDKWNETAEGLRGAAASDGGSNGGGRHESRRVNIILQKESARRPVSRVLSDIPCGAPGRPFLWDAHCCAPRATNPGDGAEAPLHQRFRAMPAAPIRSCSRWGLPCRPCCQGRGALLPHRFTLACGGCPLRDGRRRRSVLCGTFPGVAPAGR